MTRPRAESRILDAAARRALGGTFAELPQGVTRYRLQGRSDGDLVVLIHGYSVGSFVWEPLEMLLAAQGFATLSFDMPGHGFTDRPKANYTRTLFRDHLAALIETLAPNARLHLVGWSMGAMVASEFAVRHNDRVASLFFVSPSGLPIRIGVLGRTAFVPVLGDLGFAMIGSASLRAAQANFFADGKAPQPFLDRYDRQAAFKGFARAMLSTLRCMNMDDFREGYAALGASDLPVEVVWARADRATPFANHETFARLVPEARIHPLDGVGHASQFEAPDLIASSLLPWLREKIG
ncbi:alpha/beta fold hydrolase [Erythrobacter colymbi]|uniref:alpha/beta fold hydrolase n=1 Tax=Erythrobacter colymbi TaxID=1161202 RepID=UPI000A3CFF40|nr:alpha/beta fold hydrolase [Erythrobacter colymbi]